MIKSPFVVSCSNKKCRFRGIVHSSVNITLWILIEIFFMWNIYFIYTLKRFNWRYVEFALNGNLNCYSTLWKIRLLLWSPRKGYSNQPLDSRIIQEIGVIFGFLCINIPEESGTSIFQGFEIAPGRRQISELSYLQLFKDSMLKPLKESVDFPNYHARTANLVVIHSIACRIVGYHLNSL